MSGNDIGYLDGVLKRVRADVAAIPLHVENAEAWLRAVVDHSERCEREAQAETEQGGTVLLEARDLQADVRLFKDNRLAKFKPMLRFYDGRPLPEGYQIDEKLSRTHGIMLRGQQRRPGTYRKPPVPDGNPDPEAEALDKCAAAAGLTDLEQAVFAHMRDPRRTDTEAAKLLGVSQGYLSKIQPKIVEKMRKARVGYLEEL
jgi:hypothetical protein